ncbi:MAG: Gfo/Idh/MocA family oxidoreductase [Spirochaetales bacterium]|nr:Gfo/Idh/MocA family oxidoreductase [Spirochaetales bacterium]
MGLGIGLAGISHPHGTAYLETLQSIENVERIYLTDADRKYTNKLKKSVSSKIIVVDISPEIPAKLEKLINNPDINAWILLLPPVNTPPMALKVLQAGKHLLVEKPGAVTADALSSIVELAERKKLIFSVSYPLQLHPVSIAIKDRINKGCIGKPLSFEARWIASQVKYRNPQSWLFQKKLSGGGILAWLGCHLIDLLRYLLADEIETVACITERLDDNTISVEDTAVVAARFVNGTTGTIRLGYHLPVSKHGYLNGSYDTYISLSGKEGFIKWEPKTDTAHVFTMQSVSSNCSNKVNDTQYIAYVEKKGYSGHAGWAFINRFLEGITGSAEQYSNGRDAVNTLRVIEASYKSGRERKFIEIQYGS